MIVRVSASRAHFCEAIDRHLLHVNLRQFEFKEIPVTLDAFLVNGFRDGHKPLGRYVLGKTKNSR